VKFSANQKTHAHLLILSSLNNKKAATPNSKTPVAKNIVRLDIFNKGSRIPRIPACPVTLYSLAHAVNVRITQQLRKKVFKEAILRVNYNGKRIRAAFAYSSYKAALHHRLPMGARTLNTHQQMHPTSSFHPKAEVADAAIYTMLPPSISYTVRSASICTF
jgi:hypothetical protein